MHMESTKARILIAGLLAVLLVELLRTAWISDDAAITLRVVLNFLEGYGPNFNVGERVQAYTHPLWFLALSGLSALVDNVFYATYLLAITVSLAAAWLLAVPAATGGLAAGALGLVVLALSRAWVDYSTSGLENPLSHLLLILVFLAGLSASTAGNRRNLTLCFTLCGLLYLTRPDLLLLVAPFAAWVLWRTPQPLAVRARAVAIGAIPVLAWTLFSLWYYGFPFPNTAYAKLLTGIPLDERIWQGLRYVQDSLTRDPITLAVTGAGIAAGLRGTPATRALALGIVAYLAYVTSIGGDFMSGRFFSAPMVAALTILVRIPFSPRSGILAGTAAVLLGSTGLHATLLSGKDYSARDLPANGIADERGYYFQLHGHSLLGNGPAAPALPAWHAGSRQVNVRCRGLGYFSLGKGPGTHIIDPCALTDPLLARLPARHKEKWRIGHFDRQLPTDYIKSISRNENLLADARTRDYYDTLRLITRGRLGDPARWHAILRMNLGSIPVPDHAMYRNGVVHRTSQVPALPLASFATGQPVGFVDRLDILLPAATRVEAILITTGGDDDYVVGYLENGKYIAFVHLKAPRSGEFLTTREVRLPTPTPPTTRLRVQGVGDGGRSDGIYALGRLVVAPPRSSPDVTHQGPPSL